MINLNFSYSSLYFHRSILFKIDTSTPPRITFKYGSFRGNVSDIRERFRELVFKCSDISARRSVTDNAVFNLSNDGEEFVDGNE